MIDDPVGLIVGQIEIIHMASRDERQFRPAGFAPSHSLKHIADPSPVVQSDAPCPKATPIDRTRHPFQTCTCIDPDQLGAVCILG
jgi:hypothetical protein